MNHHISRREVCRLGGAAALSGSLLNTSLNYKNASAKPSILPAESEWRNKQSGMSYRRLGRTGYMISEVVMGGNYISPDKYKHVELAIDMGLNYLDTAPAYGGGASEKGYSLVINGSSRRERVFINSKATIFDNNRREVYKKILDSLPSSEQQKIDREVHELIERRGLAESTYVGKYFQGQFDEIYGAYLSNVMEPKYGHLVDRRKEYYGRIIQSVEETLSRLGTDHLDLLMCPHGASSPEELKIPEIHEAFHKLKKDGKIRACGVSSHSDPAGVIRQALDTGIYDAAMVAYNVVNGDYVNSILWEAYEKDFGVIAMKVARPVYTGRPNTQAPQSRVEKLNRIIPGDMKLPMKAYLWALQNPNLTAVISEMPDADHVKDNLPLAGKKVELIPLEREGG